MIIGPTTILLLHDTGEDAVSITRHENGTYEITVLEEGTLFDVDALIEVLGMIKNERK